MFNLPCRLVKAIDRPSDDIAILWVEDGTKCPLTTLISFDPSDPESSHEVSTSQVICIKTSKQLLIPTGCIPNDAEHPLLYICGIRPNPKLTTDGISVCYEFQVTVSVELRRDTTREPNRLWKALMNRLETLGPRFAPPSQENSTSAVSPSMPPTSSSGMIPTSDELATERAMREMSLLDENETLKTAELAYGSDDIREQLIDSSDEEQPSTNGQSPLPGNEEESDKEEASSSSSSDGNQSPALDSAATNLREPLEIPPR